jgi:hypothetical protein
VVRLGQLYSRQSSLLLEDRYRGFLLYNGLDISFTKTCTLHEALNSSDDSSREQSGKYFKDYDAVALCFCPISRNGSECGLAAISFLVGFDGGVQDQHETYRTAQYSHLPM